MVVSTLSPFETLIEATHRSVQRGELRSESGYAAFSGEVEANKPSLHRSTRSTRFYRVNRLEFYGDKRKAIAGSVNSGAVAWIDHATACPRFEAC
jgi:hypothetical protein